MRMRQIKNHWSQTPVCTVTNQNEGLFTYFAIIIWGFNQIKKLLWQIQNYAFSLQRKKYCGFRCTLKLSLFETFRSEYELIWIQVQDLKHVHTIFKQTHCREDKIPSKSCPFNNDNAGKSEQHLKSCTHTRTKGL